MGQHLFRILIILIQLVYGLNILSIADHFTSEDYRVNYHDHIENTLSSLPFYLQVEYTWLECTPSSDLETIINQYTPDLVFDFTQTLLIKTRLSQISLSYSFIHVMVTPPYQYSQPSSFSLLHDYTVHYKALVQTMKHFNWEEFIYITTDDSFSIEFIYYLSQQQITPKYILTISQSTTYESVLIQVGKILKPLGRKIFLLSCVGEISTMVLKAMNDKKLTGYGYGVVLSYLSGLYTADEREIFKNGLLGVIEENMIGLNYAEYIQNKITALFNSLELLCKENCSSYILQESLYNNYFTTQQLKLINVQNYAGHIIGYFESNSKMIYDSIIFPGYSLEVPINSPVSIVISIPTDLTNPSGVINTLSLPIFAGAVIAIQDINSSDLLLPNFDVVKHDYGYGSLEFDYDWSKKKIERYKDGFGVTLLSSLRSSGTLGLMDVLEEMNITKPIIGSTNTATELSDSSKYPLYIRTVLSDSFMPYLYMRVCAYFNWMQISILYIDDVWGDGIYQAMLESAKTLKIEFMNSEHLRKIPAVFNETTIPIESIKDVIDSGTRVVILAVIDLEVNMIIETFYDLGMREGDLVILAIEWLNKNVLIIGEKEDIDKRKELLKGALQVFPRTWIGDIGKRVKEDIKEYTGYEEHYQGCFYYDSGIFAAHGIDYLVRYGEDYNDPIKLIESLRFTKFTGCTGVVRIEENSNDREAMTFSVQNMQYASSTDEWNLKEVIIYDPFSTQVVSFTAAFQWPLNSPTVPESMRSNDSDCPFDSKDLHTFNKGLFLLFGICYTLIFLAILTTTLLWFNIWNFSILPLTTRKEITIRDYYVILTLFVDFLQISNLGPDFTNTNDYIAYVSQIASSDLVSLIRFRKGVFWICLDVVISVCMLWFVMMLFVLFKLDAKFRRFNVVRWIGKFSEIFLPIGGELLFLPIMSILLNVFECEEAVGDPDSLDYLDSILSKDCNAKCWHSEHIMYVCLSLFSFIIYQPFAVMTLPLWSILEDNVNIRPQPQFLMVRVIVELILVVVYKTIRKVSEIAHSIIFLLILSMYITYLSLYRPYNYGRASCWKILSLMCVFWLSLIALVDNELCIRCKFSPSILLVSGWTVILGCGVVFIKRNLPALLYNESKDIRMLMDFGMRRKSQVLASDIAHKLNTVLAQHLGNLQDKKNDDSELNSANVLTDPCPEGINMTFQRTENNSREEMSS